MQLWVCGSRVLSPVASLLVFLYHMPARCFKCAAHKHIHTYTIHTYIHIYTDWCYIIPLYLLGCTCDWHFRVSFCQMYLNVSMFCALCVRHFLCCLLLLLFCFLHCFFCLFFLTPPSFCWHLYGLCLIWASWPRQANWKFEIINVIDCATPTNQWCRQWLMGQAPQAAKSLCISIAANCGNCWRRGASSNQKSENANRRIASAAVAILSPLIDTRGVAF